MKKVLLVIVFVLSLSIISSCHEGHRNRDRSEHHGERQGERQGQGERNNEPHEEDHR